MENNEQQVPSIYSSLPPELVEKMTPMKMRVINLFMTGLYNQSEIASLVGMNKGTISSWLKQPEIMAVIKELQNREYDYMEAQIKNLRNKAINTMSELLDSPIDTVKLSAAKDILNRTGHGATQKVSIEKKNVNIESAMKDMNIVDISPSDYKVIDLDDILNEVKNND